jgi:hypothetical protein
MDTQVVLTMTVLCLGFCSCLSEEGLERQEPGTVPAGLGIGSDLVTGRGHDPSRDGKLTADYEGTLECYLSCDGQVAGLEEQLAALDPTTARPRDWERIERKQALVEAMRDRCQTLAGSLSPDDQQRLADDVESLDLRCAPDFGSPCETHCADYARATVALCFESAAAFGLDALVGEEAVEALCLLTGELTEASCLTFRCEEPRPPEECVFTCWDISNAWQDPCLDLLGGEEIAGQACEFGSRLLNEHCRQFFACSLPCAEQCWLDVAAANQACWEDDSRTLCDEADALEAQLRAEGEEEGETEYPRRAHQRACEVEYLSSIHQCFYGDGGCYTENLTCGDHCHGNSLAGLAACLDEPLCGASDECYELHVNSLQVCFSGCCLSDCVGHTCVRLCEDDEECLESCRSFCQDACFPQRPCEIRCHDEALELLGLCFEDEALEVVCQEVEDPVLHTCTIGYLDRIGSCIYYGEDSCRSERSSGEDACAGDAIQGVVDCMAEPLCRTEDECWIEVEPVLDACLDGCCLSECVSECTWRCGDHPECLASCVVEDCQSWCFPEPPCWERCDALWSDAHRACLADYGGNTWLCFVLADAVFAECRQEACCLEPCQDDCEAACPDPSGGCVDDCAGACGPSCALAPCEQCRVAVALEAESCLLTGAEPGHCEELVYPALTECLAICDPPNPCLQDCDADLDACVGEADPSVPGSDVYCWDDYEACWEDCS